MKYLHGFKDEVGPSAWRGSAVEAGLDLWLYKRDLKAAHEAAIARFEIDAVGLADDATDKERKAIPDMLEIATGLLVNKPEPSARQLKIEHWFDGIEVPIIGYVDYVWPDEGYDLKTTMRMPSDVPGNHARQGALYSTATGKPWKFLYITPKKGEIKPLDNAVMHLKHLETSARAIRRILNVSNNKTDIAHIFVPDFDHYFFKREAAREAAAQIWT